MSDSRVELGRSFSLVVLAVLGVVWASIAAALILLGARSLAAHRPAGILWFTLAAAAAGVAIYHWRLVWNRQVPKWFTEFIRNQ